MTAEEFYYKTYTGESALYDMSPEQAIEFAEAYAEHFKNENEGNKIIATERGEAIIELQKQVEELKEEVRGYKTANELMKQALKK